MKRKSSCLGLLVIGCLVVVVLSAIISNLPGGAPAAPTASKEATAVFVATAEPTAQPRGFVSRAGWGNNWPLTVDDGVLNCYPDLGKAVTLTTGGIEYGVNTPARSSKAPSVWRDANDIMLADVLANSVSDKRLFALIDEGLKLCEG